MSERARSYADRLEQANRELIATVERLSDGEWRTPTAGEGWSAGVVAHHVAENHHTLIGLVQLIADGRSLPSLTWETIHRGNAEHARKHAETTKGETLDLLRRDGAAAAAAVRGLTDAQLDRSASVLGGTMTAAQAIERVLIGHVAQHHESIKGVVGR
jgi:uncharacterized damage-inducible protein DinB